MTGQFDRGVPGREVLAGGVFIGIVVRMGMDIRSGDGCRAVLHGS